MITVQNILLKVNLYFLVHETISMIFPLKKISDNEIKLRESVFTKEFTNDINNEMPSDEEIKLNIQKIFSGDFAEALKSINFFELKLRKFDIILPHKYFEITMNIFHSHMEDQKIIDLLLKFYRHCTGFQSEMQIILAERNIIDLILPFFPSPDVLDIYGNLSLANINIRNRLLSMGIINQIVPFISVANSDNSSQANQINLNIFENAVNLLNCLVYKLDGFDYTNWIPSFIMAFDVLHSLYVNAEANQAVIIVRAFSDYIEAHPAFIESFLVKGQLGIFIEKDLSNNKIYRWISEIVISIISEYKTQGAEYLNNNSIIEWVSKQLFSSSQKVVDRCFYILIELINSVNSPHYFANQCIEHNFLTMAIDKFHSEVKYSLRITLYEFICVVFANATTSQIPLMINDKALELIVDNFEIIDEYCSAWPFVFYAIQRILQFYPCDEENKNEDVLIVHEAVNKIKENGDFIDWVFKLRNCEEIAETGDLEEVIEILVSDTENNHCE